MAELMLRTRLTERGVEATVTSTGLMSAGRPVPKESITVMRRAGFDVSRHRSSVLSTAAIAAADLIVALERYHLRESVVLDPTSFGRTFTLKELVRRGEQVGARRQDEPLAEWLGRLSRGREIADLVGIDDADDVADPFGRSVHEYEATRAELAGLIDRLADLLAPRADARSA